MIGYKIIISKNTLIIASTLSFLLVLYRFALPFGDEPDFAYRVENLLYEQHSAFSIYNYFQGVLGKYNWSVDGTNEATSLKILRIIMTLLALIPFVSILFSKKKMLTGLDDSNHHKIMALCLSLLVPSVIYYLGVFAQEQLTLVLSLLIYAFIDNNKKVVIALLAGIFVIDIGNSIVVGGFIAFYYFLSWVRARFGLRIGICIGVSMVICSYLMGMKLLLLLDKIPVIGDKVNLIYLAYTTDYSYVIEKYPLILRPIITFISSVFMLPSKQGIFFLIPLYFLFFLALSYAFFLVKKPITLLYNMLIPVLFILIMVFMLPGFSQAKYYVFTIPFVMEGLVYCFSVNSIYLFLMLSNMFVLFVLLTV